MTRMGAFEKVVALAEALSLGEKETLMELLRARTRGERRRQLAGEIAAARREHKLGRAKVMTAVELIAELSK